MKVKRVIEELQKYDPEVDVWGSSMGLRATWHTRRVRVAYTPDPRGVVHPVIEVVEDPIMEGEDGTAPLADEQ